MGGVRRRRGTPMTSVLLVACLGLQAACTTGGTGGGPSGDAVHDWATVEDVPITEDGAIVLPDGPGPADSGPKPDVGTPPDGGSEPDVAVEPDVPVTPPPSGYVVPGCPDGDYAETLPTPSSDISAEVAGYSAAQVQSFLLSVLAKRYPVGAFLVEGALANPAMGNCVQTFAYDTSSAAAAIGTLSTVVHECGHMFDFSAFGWGESTYYITDTVSMSCAGGDMKSFGGKTFPRSLLTQDSFSALHPPCPEGSWGGDCDFYGNTYLTGQSGDQGFDTLMEEAVQYVNSLATGYAVNDYYVWSASERDGILTFLWYMERYLYLARTEHPDTYGFLMGDPCWRNLMLTVWGRAWLFLETTEDIPTLGLDDDVIEGLVANPVLLAEIDALRDAHSCP